MSISTIFYNIYAIPENFLIKKYFSKLVSALILSFRSVLKREDIDASDG